MARPFCWIWQGLGLQIDDKRGTHREPQGVGFLTGFPGGILASLGLLAGDITYLMAIAGRGCYGVGHILKKKVDYEGDIPMIVAIWSGAAHVATTATVGEVALKVANPIIIKAGTASAVKLGGLAAVSLTELLVGKTGTKLLEKLVPKFIAKVGAQLASKAVAFAVPVAGAFVSCGINWWICGGLMHAAETYYLAEFVVLEGDIVG